MADEPAVDTKDVGDLLDPVISTWDEGIARIRNGARWVLVVLGAAAAFIFGAGTLGKRPELSWSENTGQLALALVCAVAALLLLGLVVREVARVFTPEVVALDDPEVTGEFATREVEYFGPRAVPGVPPRTQLRFAEEAVVVLENASVTAGGVDLTAPLREARQRLAEFQMGAAALLGIARYRRIEAKRSVRPWVWWAAGGALALGIVYQLALSTPAKSEEAAASGASGGGLAVLVLNETDAGAAAVWEAVGLADCAPATAIPGTEGTLALVDVVSGAGTEESPWTVRTVPEGSTPGCERFEVVVPAGVASKVEAVPVEKTVNVPAPTVTWRIGGSG